jgi:hypothetical protein
MVLNVFWLDVEWGEQHYNTIILWVDIVVLEVYDIVAVLLVKSAFSPAEHGWQATLQQQFTSIHFG